MVLEDDALKRWMTIEAHQVNQATVTKPRPLSELLAEQAPSAATKSGEDHRFDVEALEAFAAELSPLAKAMVRLPITVYLSHKTSQDAYVMHEGAIEALAQHGVTTNEPRDGKLWIGVPLARDFARRFPTCVQFVLT